MFNVYDENNKKVTVYAVKEENGILQFLMYFGQWEWHNASSFYAIQEIDALCSLKDKFSSQTNAEKIRSMSVDELANFILSIDIDECSRVTTIGDTEIFSNLSDAKEWLESEVEE